MKSYAVRPLDASTWDAFAELVERNNGIFGGCWCIAYHLERGEKGTDYRAAKQARVAGGRAHAALVFDDDGAAQGWCQYGSPEELPNIKHRREYDKDAPPSPDWRITCFYVDRKHRAQGIARAALEGALDQPDPAAWRQRAGSIRESWMSSTSAGRDRCACSQASTACGRPGACQNEASSTCEVETRGTAVALGQQAECVRGEELVQGSAVPGGG